MQFWEITMADGTSRKIAAKTWEVTSVGLLVLYGQNGEPVFGVQQHYLVSIEAVAGPKLAEAA